MAKIVEERKARFNANRLVRKMLEIDKDDHADLTTILKNIKKQDVPEDMAVLCQQQADIEKTEN